MRRGILLYAMLAVVLAAAFGPYFARNVSWLLSERALSGLIEGRLDFVLLYVAIFSSFTLFLFFPFRRDRWQKSNLAYVAFIVALFTEMFGFPLTIYLLSSLTPLPNPGFEPAVAMNVDLPGLQFRLLTTSAIAGAVTLVSAAFIVLGWREIFMARKGKGIVRSGIYGRVRHPQYTGIMLIITAWVFAWPTLPTLVMWPVLLYAYYRLARKEEQHMLKASGKEYGRYMKEVPMLLPGWNW